MTYANTPYVDKTRIPHPVDVVCSSCRSPNVKRDAWASWNLETQQWELESVHDHAYCDDCGGETKTEEIPHKNAIPELLKRCMAIIDHEIEQRQHGGNDEDWAELKALSDQCVEALFDAGETDHGSTPETA
jgi:hypothetical protein